jgi:hypothetical protein
MEHPVFCPLNFEIRGLKFEKDHKYLVFDYNLKMIKINIG